jgi:hypothetical protein
MMKCRYYSTTVRFDESVPSAGMVGKQGVAAAVLLAASGTAVLYMSAAASLCKRQPTIIVLYDYWQGMCLEHAVCNSSQEPS